MLIKFKDLKQLHRTSDSVFMGIHSLGLLKSWNLEFIESRTINNELIIINYDTLVNATPSEIQVTNPTFICSLPDGNEKDEYPVLYIGHSYLPVYFEEKLMSIDYFSRLIEKSDRISSNSTKLMTLHSLRGILKNLYSIPIKRDHWYQMSVGLITYLQSLIKEYPYLGYLPVAERKAFRKTSTADVSFAWELYFKFFIKEWDAEHLIVEIPDMSKPFMYKDWVGNFFDRENPFWKLYVGKSGKFKFSESNSESIYCNWIRWIKGA